MEAANPRQHNRAMLLVQTMLEIWSTNFPTARSMSRTFCSANMRHALFKLSDDSHRAFAIPSLCPVASCTPGCPKGQHRKKTIMDSEFFKNIIIYNFTKSKLYWGYFSIILTAANILLIFDWKILPAASCFLLEIIPCWNIISVLIEKEECWTIPSNHILFLIHKILDYSFAKETNKTQQYSSCLNV